MTLAVLARGKAGDSFEEAGKMVRKVKTQQAGGLIDVMTLHQQAFRLINNIIMDVADSRTACCLMNDIAEISGRIGQLRGTPGNGGR